MKNLFKKLKLAFKDVKPVVKDMTVGSGSYGYKAVSEKAVLNAIKPSFEKHSLILIPIDHDTKTTINQIELGGKLKTSVFVEIKSTYDLVDLDSGEVQRVCGVGSGIDTQDKAVGKAMTYAYKNMLLKLFMLFSGEDTDNHHSNDLDATQTTTAPKKEAGTNKTWFNDKELNGLKITIRENKSNLTGIRSSLKKYSFSTEMKASVIALQCEGYHDLKVW